MRFHNYSCSKFKVQGCPPPGVSARPGRLPVIIIIILFLLVFPFSPSSGKVFWSRFFSRDQSIFDASGWRRIYQAPLTINGGRATLSVHGCDEPLELTKTRLKQKFSSAKESYSIENGNSFWILSSVGNQLSRLLALAMPDSDKSLIIVIDQSAAEFSKSKSVPAESIFAGYALLPASRVETIIKNEETGAALETLIADAAPDAVISEISAKLSRHGWKQVCPAGNDDHAKRYFLIFRRGEALCTVLAGPALCENKSCVTILLKEKTDHTGE